MIMSSKLMETSVNNKHTAIWFFIRGETCNPTKIEEIYRVSLEQYIKNALT